MLVFLMVILCRIKIINYDKYAIGVYRSDDTHFGFIEKGQKAIYGKIENGFGYIDVKLEINTFIDNTNQEKFHGTVVISKTDLI